MGIVNWLLVVIPVALIIGFGWYTRRFVTGVADFLVAGRVCNRYVITTGNLANALGLITLAGYIEVRYSTGFGVIFWSSFALPIGMMYSLTGFCTYRFRETRAMSFGQFLEMRYSRKLRIFSCFLRSMAEMMANVIMPALAARFFIIYMDLPQNFTFFGFTIPTFMVIVLITLTLAVSLVCFSGMLSIIVTDTLQCLMCFPLILVLIIFVLTKFSWSSEMFPVLADRVSGQSFLNPYDVKELRNFNLFMVLASFAMSWNVMAGATGGSNCSRSPHEGKMAAILGTWRGGFSSVFYTIIAVAIITLMCHQHFANEAKQVRDTISQKISEELIQNPQERTAFMAKIRAIPEQHHIIGKDKPLSNKQNLDTVYYKTVMEFFGTSGEGSKKAQQYITIYRQQMLPGAMKVMLPPILYGLFALMIVMFIISTDDSRLYSASSTLIQDCVVPFYKNEDLPPEKHVKLIRLISIGVGVFFLVGSYFMRQLDYINLFVHIMYGMWSSGCGAMILFGLYSRFGTTIGAWSSLLTGMFISLGGVIAQRTWAGTLYPLLEKFHLVEPVGNLLTTLSSPFNPYIVWEMNRFKFPINSFEICFIASLLSLLVYIAVSLLTCHEPFNLERMLHRGKYAVEGEKNIKSQWTWKSVWGKLIGITPEYTLSDKAIAWSVFIYTFIYRFFFTFIIVMIWNLFSPWPTSWWGLYFLVVFLLVPGVAAAFTLFWFGYGGIRDLHRMFRDLKNRVANPLDNGMVEGHVSIAEKEQLEKK